MGSDADDYYEPLTRLAAGDVVEVAGLCRGSVRRFAPRASAQSFTEDGYDGAFLDGAFEGGGMGLLWLHPACRCPSVCS